MSRYDMVLLLGLDGGDWRLLQPLVNAGKMPNLAELLKGAAGTLNSTLRPESSVAWSTVLTGVNPGKHGIFGFMHLKESDPPQYEIANGAHIQAPRFWDRLAEQGVSTGLIHLPFTYPPTEMDGFCISGMMTPGANTTFTYPSMLGDAILKRFPDLTFDVGEAGRDREKLLAAAIKFTKLQGEMATFMLSQRPVNFFGIVLTAIDRVQHFAWPDIDWNQIEAARIEEAFPADLLHFFEVVDQVIGQIIAALPPNHFVLTLSDHGFNGVKRKFYLNKWLEEEGLLVPNLRQAASRSLISNALETLKRNRLARRVKRLFLPDDWGPAKFRTSASGWSIDWEKTKVYFSPDGGLRFNPNLPPEEKNTLETRLIRSLPEIIDPETGKPPIAKVFPKRDLYTGPQLDRAPDLIAEPQREAPDRAANYILVRGNEPDAPLFSSSEPYNGNHAQEGIIILSGDGLKSGMEISADIVDIVPTLLAVLDTPLPAYLDGNALIDAFEEGAQPTLRLDSRDLDDFNRPGSDPKVEEDDQSAVEDRLRNLGYID